MLTLLAAMPDEVKAILSDGFYQWQREASNIYRSPKGLILGITGLGKVNAASLMTRLLSESEHFLVMGTAGSTQTDAIGTLYLIHEFVEHDMDVTGLGFKPGVTPFDAHSDFVYSNASADFINSLKTAFEKTKLPYQIGRIMSGDQFINSAAVSELKYKLFSAQLVDMESAAIAKVGFKNHKEVLAVRMVSDNANHDAHVDWSESVKNSSVKMNQLVRALLQ
jgi:adenosylhomocysteine nucleosidase